MDARTYRSLIGQFATGVTVVTTNVEGRLHGMTANAVTSVSLEPILLLVCIDVKTNCHRQMETASSFGLSILSADQEPISNLFASPSEPTENELLGVDYRLGKLGVPLIDGALVHFECTISERLAGGDHTIVLGEVENAEQHRAGAPLLFFGGRYGALSA